MRSPKSLVPNLPKRNVKILNDHSRFPSRFTYSSLKSTDKLFLSPFRILERPKHRKSKPNWLYKTANQIIGRYRALIPVVQSSSRRVLPCQQFQESHPVQVRMQVILSLPLFFFLSLVSNTRTIKCDAGEDRRGMEEKRKDAFLNEGQLFGFVVQHLQMPKL
jgi:hypothetical protein